MSPWTRWPLTARGTGAALLAALCFVLAHQFGIPELLYLSLLLAQLLRIASEDARAFPSDGPHPCMKRAPAGRTSGGSHRYRSTTVLSPSR